MENVSYVHIFLKWQGDVSAGLQIHIAVTVGWVVTKAQVYVIK